MSGTERTERTDPPPVALRYGLVRPGQGRYVAGVCAALGRATRTDPVLWRVVLAVLLCFMGLGGLIYLVVWLLTPSDDDTASPLESLLGRGHSTTNPVLAGLLALAVLGMLAALLPRPLYVLLGAAVVAGLVLLINRSRTSPAPAGSSPAGSPPDAAAAESPSADPIPAAAATDSMPADSMPADSTPAGRVTDRPAWPPPPLPPLSPLPPPPPPASVPVSPSPAEPASGYRPPFAPHGPFATSLPPPLPPPPPRPPRERSRLAPVTLLLTMLVLGLLAAVDAIAPVRVPPAGYVATALVVVGSGLLVGTWRGRARGLIALAAVLALALPVVNLTDAWDRPDHSFGEFQWTPASMAELTDEYSLMFGEGQLDLRQVDMSGQETTVRVEVRFGGMEVLVPEDVAVEATVDARFGGARVLGQESEGVTQDRITDPGGGDPADGTLRLFVDVSFGYVEVYR